MCVIIIEKNYCSLCFHDQMRQKMRFKMRIKDETPFFVEGDINDHDREHSYTCNISHEKQTQRVQGGGDAAPPERQPDWNQEG